MKKNVNYMILPEYKLILECCKGQASVEDSIQMKKAELSDKFYNSNYNIIVDFQNFDHYLDQTVFESVGNFFEFLKKSKIENRVAFLTSEPVQVVVGMILKKSNIDSGSMKLEVFSTLEAALIYLGYPVEAFDTITSKIKELNKYTAIDCQ
jgi:hypothetical protein